MPTPTEVPAPQPLTQDDVHKLIGSLYLEIDFLRRQIQQLRTYIETNGMPTAPPSSREPT